MKSIKSFTMLMALAFVSIAFTACDDDNKIERPDYTKVKYTCSFGEDFLKFYDVVANYTDIDGISHTETITARNWQYEGRKDGAQPGMRCNVTATLKSETPDLSATQFDLTYNHTLYFYSKATSAIEEKPETSGAKYLKEGISTYLNDPSKQTITILDFTPNAVK